MAPREIMLVCGVFVGRPLLLNDTEHHPRGFPFREFSPLSHEIRNVSDTPVAILLPYLSFLS